MKIKDLNRDWILKNKQKEISLTVDVPSTVFESLIEDNEIENPFYGLNERKVKWVYESDWIYEKEFYIEKEFLNNSNIFLRFHGLDTIAEIHMNKTLLGKTDNMFKKFDFNIKEILNKGKNQIKILFKSPTKYAKEQVKLYKDKLTTGEITVAIPGAPYLRKAQYQFGWDWGPKLPDIGIWKPVELIGYNELKIENVQIKTKFPNDLFKNNLNIEEILKTVSKSEIKVNINLELSDSGSIVDTSNYKIIILLADSTRNEILKKKKKIQKKNLSIQIVIENPKLWWTHDLGTPFLYNLEIIFLKNDKIIQRKKLKLGLRDIQLIKKKDKWGESFYFKLNGIPLFAKGANWIPIDSFIPRGKKKALYNRNLKDAKASNMNMLRVWGGGIYEDDRFYQLCDELGILVWQDFPFACATYPYHQEFIDNVKKEAIENIERLRNHPSLALWCGNNEIEYLWRILLINSNIKREEKAYREGYLKLFEDLLPKLVKKYDPQRNYWPSSPSNGFTNGKVGRINSNSPERGDSHYWSVWHGGKSFSSYRRFNSRFMSEFGFESFPSIKTIKSFSSSESFQVNSKIMENHQKNPDGNDKILKYMKKRFDIPKDFQKKIILSQITQAEAIEYGVKHWRSKRNNFHCMGSLYWQLNDCWPVASWSSVDYFGRWKALHYFAKRFYQNIIGFVFEKRGNLKIYTVNDSLEPVELLFEYEIVNTKGNIIIQQNFSVKIPPLHSKLIEQKNLDIFDFNKDNKILIYRLIRKRDNKTIDHGYYLFKDPKEYDLMNPELKMSIEFKKKDSKDPQLEAIIKSKRISLFTYIYSNLVDFISSDNFFPMNSNETKSVLIKIKNYREEKERLENIKDSIYVKSLYDLVRS